jgi:hypothetical protein
MNSVKPLWYVGGSVLQNQFVQVPLAPNKLPLDGLCIESIADTFLKDAP